MIRQQDRGYVCLLRGNRLPPKIWRAPLAGNCLCCTVRLDDLFVDQHVYFFTGEQLCSTSFNMFLRLFYNLFCVFNGINLVNDLGNPNLPSSFPHYPQKSF